LQAVLPLLDALSPEAEAMGAVNTVVIRGGRMVGHNTDGSGWAWGLRRSLPDADLACVVLLGAGGAGSAIADAVLRLGAAQLRVVDTDLVRAVALAEALKARFGDRVIALADAAQALEGATGLVHATPTGMDKLPGMPIAASLLRPSLWVSEIVYFPLNTGLLQAARAAGCPTVDGGAMAVGQAVGAFELFTGLQADARRMEQHFRTLLGPGV
jgi:shikimate dehydrogenase